MANIDVYFRFAHPGWMLTLGLLLYVHTLSTFCPEKIPSYFGPLGSLGRYLGTTYPTGMMVLYTMTVLAHIVEALYSIKLCRDRKLNTAATSKWFLQTLIFGFASLIVLSPYKPKSK